MRIAGAESGRRGVTQQLHARLGRRPAALLPVAGDAAGDDVLPVLAAALGDRHHVVERQLRRGHRLVAVLAGVIVAGVDIGAGERDVVEPAFDPDEAEQADDRGQLEADRHRPNLAVVDRDHLNLPLAPERNRLLPVDDLEWLVRGVEKERLLHDRDYDNRRARGLSRMADSRRLVNTVSYTDIAACDKALGAVVLVCGHRAGACAPRGGVPAAVSRRGAPSRRHRPAEAADRRAAPTPAATVTAGPNRCSHLDGADFRGIPYRNGGTDPSGFDCSGFVQYVFAQHGTALPREVAQQYRVGRDHRSGRGEAWRSVFFETVSRGASHVGMAVGDGRFVHAPSSRGVVRVEKLHASYWARRFVGARRVVVACPAPSGLPGAVAASN